MFAGSGENVSVDVKPEKQKRKRAKADVPAPDYIAIDVVNGGESRKVRVLRPISIRDTLYVEYDEDVIASVLTRIRDGPFEEEGLYAKRDETRPSGVWKRKGHFVVASEGKFTRVKTLEEATAALSAV